jgi:hypothetical protein
MDVLGLLVHFLCGRAFEFVGVLTLRARFRCGRAISSLILDVARDFSTGKNLLPMRQKRSKINTRVLCIIMIYMA